MGTFKHVVMVMSLAGVVSLALPARAASASGPALKSPRISTAVHTQSRNPSVEALQAKIRQQQAELQQLQDEVDRAQEN